MSRCPKRAPNPSLPAGMPVEIARHSPRHAHLLHPGAQCEHDTGHDGPHRNGLLVWHDPPKVIVGGVEFSECPETHDESEGT